MIALRNRQILPLIRTGKISVGFLEHLGCHGSAHTGINLGSGRPDVFQEYDLAVAAAAKTKPVLRYTGLEFAGGIKRVRPAHHTVHVAGNTHGDNERRRSKEICIHGFVYAALKIAVARQHGSDTEFAVLLGIIDSFRNAFQQGTAIADAGGASITDQVEAELVEIRLQPCSFQITGHREAAWRQRRLHMRRHREAKLNGFLRDQGGGDHHIRIGCIGAGRNGSDHKIAVAEFAGTAAGFGDGNNHVGQLFLEISNLARVRRGPLGKHVGVGRKGFPEATGYVGQVHPLFRLLGT